MERIVCEGDLELLDSGTYYDFIDLNVAGLFDGVGNRAGDGIGRDGDLVELLHVQSCGDAVEHTLDVDVDHLVPFVHLQSCEPCDGHDAGVIHQHVDLAVSFQSRLDECVDLLSLRDVDRDRQRLTALRSDVLHDGVKPILAACSEYDGCSEFCEVRCGAFPETTARACNHYDFSFNV